MKKLLNTLYITTETSYLTLDGENIVVSVNKEEKVRFPLHLFESIICFSYPGASPALMGKCAKEGIGLSFYTPKGHFLTRCSNGVHGNVLLRKAQIMASENPEKCLAIAKSFLLGKLFNSRWTLERTKRDNALRVDCALLEEVSKSIHKETSQSQCAQNIDTLRGVEGLAANQYFGVFDAMILNNKEDFHFTVRSKRPPLDRINALLSFAYSLLANDCANALEGVGLDPYVGFLHCDRPGRFSLALDLMEELRSCFADRFVISLVNRSMITHDDFIECVNSSILLSDSGRKVFLKQWQIRKQEEIMHPFLQVKIPWGLIPHVQALLLARYLRGDLDGYPPFLWK